MLLVHLISLCIELTSAATTYWITLKIAGLESHCATSNPLFIKVIGDVSDTTQRLETSGRDDFYRGYTVRYQLVSSQDVGRIQTMEMYISGYDAFLFDWVSVRSSSDTKTKYFYNMNKEWLSTEPGEGQSRISMSLQGDKTYAIFTKTGRRESASSSSLGLSMILEGGNGKVFHTSYMAPKEWSFEPGAVDEFVLKNLPDLGEVKCLTLQAVESDSWYFDWIAVQDGSGKVTKFSNEDQKWLSGDSSQGEKSIKLCV